MSDILIETSGASVLTDDFEFEFKLAYSVNETSGQKFLLVHVYKDGDLVGTPIRFKAAANRIAADLPGVDSANFITQDGHITNG